MCVCHYEHALQKGYSDFHGQKYYSQLSYTQYSPISLTIATLFDVFALTELPLSTTSHCTFSEILRTVQQSDQKAKTLAILSKLFTKLNLLFPADIRKTKFVQSLFVKKKSICFCIHFYENCEGKPERDFTESFFYLLF